MKPRDESDMIRMMIGYVECFGTGRDYIYMSTPITGGTRLYDTLEKHGARDKRQLPGKILLEEVITPNVYAAQAAAERLRKIHKKVINPAEFDAMNWALKVRPGWNQKTYLDLWEKTIARYVDRMVFNDGWEYSTGAVTEWCMYRKNLVSQGMRLPLDMPGEAITREGFLSAISQAIDDIQGRGLDSSDLEELLRDARSLD